MTAVMSLPPTLRCVFAKSAPQPPSHFFRKIHCSRIHRAPRQGPRIPPPSSLQDQKKSKGREVTGSDLRPYTKDEFEELKAKYTAAQVAAIEAGEAAIDPNDLAEQGAHRNDYFRLPYQSDDLSKIQPVIDKPVRAPEENYDPTARWKTDDEIAGDFADFIKDMPDNFTRLDYQKFIDNLRFRTGKEEAERNPVSYKAPEIPRGIPILEARAQKRGESLDPATKRLLRQTGMALTEIRRLRIVRLVSHRVVNQTRLGKIQKMYYLTIVGNQRGLLGIGEGKSAEPVDATRQAEHAAIRNLHAIPRYEQRTIFGTVTAKVGAVDVELTSRPPGTSIFSCKPHELANEVL